MKRHLNHFFAFDVLLLEQKNTFYDLFLSFSNQHNVTITIFNSQSHTRTKHVWDSIHEWSSTNYYQKHACYNDISFNSAKYKAHLMMKQRARDI